MKNKIRLLILAFLFAANTSCFDDGSTPGPKGVLKVTVNTSADIWGYPLASESLFLAYSGDSTGCWGYPSVGGDGDPAEEESLFDNLITSSTEDQGDKKNVIYLYSALGDSSSSYAVVYTGESSVNNDAVTISGIVPGTYYVVAFYDYSGGGKQTNILNRYDRYAIYTTTEPYDGTANSTPFQDKASTVTISENLTVEITLEIKCDWVLGKPKSSGGTGRLFLKSTDPIPVP